LEHDPDPGPKPATARLRVKAEHFDPTGGPVPVPSRISTVVVLPAPLGPSNAKTSPWWTVKPMPPRAFVSP